MIPIFTVFRCSSREGEVAAFLFNINILTRNQFNLIAGFNEMICFAGRCAFAIVTSCYTPTHIIQRSNQIASRNKFIGIIAGWDNERAFVSVVRCAITNR